MKKLVAALWLAGLGAPLFIADLPAREIPGRPAANRRYMTHPQPVVLPPEIREFAGPNTLSSTTADTTLLAWFTFDNGGVVDPQGWKTVDGSAQLGEFFHVADARELDGGDFGRLVPLEGAQSMWCGVDVSSTDPFCRWATLPGYGNRWDQILESSTFVCDSVFFSYEIAWDSEPTYDVTEVEYYDPATGVWVPLAVNGGAGSYDDVGEMVESFSFPVPTDSTRLRFRFTSDGGWSDEDGLWPNDGAVIVDSITVQCFNSGVLTAAFFEDFEGEAPGAKQTDDGVWAVAQPASFGDFGALYPGSTLLQEDPCVANATHLWGWFDSPTRTNYSCHVPDPRPDVGATPFRNSDGFYLDNAIWSPLLPFTGTGDEVTLSFKVYRDLPLDNLVFYWWEIIPFVGGCGPPGHVDGFVFFGGQKDWATPRFQVGFLLTGAEEFRIQLHAQDLCVQWCNLFGTGQCHSHAPLIDDVRVERINNVGPQFRVRHVDLFQDNFSADGSLTGTARADIANDIAPGSSPIIQPGDSLTIDVTGGAAGLAIDPFTGVGPSVYAYVAVWPPGQAGKAGADIEAPESRALVGTRYPLVDSLMHNGVWWYCFRMDSAFTAAGAPLADRFSFDLNDAVFTPGDTICYVLCARDAAASANYWSRRIRGQGDDFVTSDLSEALNSPCEFSILPGGGVARGGDILYVDDTDDRGGPTQLFFDWVYDYLDMLPKVDRYDVLGPSSNAGNGLASRVQNDQLQIRDSYKTIVWSSGTLSDGLIGDGNGPEKSDDYALLFAFLDLHINNPGLFITGNNIAEEWSGLIGAGAINLKSIYMTFDLADGDHIAVGEPISPLLSGVGTIFEHAGVPDQVIAFGGCPSINDFDVLIPVGTSVAELTNMATGKAYVLSQTTANSVASTARVVMSGFGLEFAHQPAQGFPFARLELFSDILLFFQSVVSPPVGFDGETAPLANFLAANYPNPFNPTTTIRYSIKERAHVSLRIYNAAGQLVRTLVHGVRTPNPDGLEATWDGRSNAGQSVSSGVYFYKMVTKGFSQTKKMVLLK
ncbi:MAG: T9SS type A sorting domain-containing protein [Candidatus Krumholzibacteria bacterium]